MSNIQSASLPKTALKRRSVNKIERFGCGPLVNELLDSHLYHDEIVRILKGKGFIVSRSCVCRYDLERRRVSKLIEKNEPCTAY